MWLRGWVTWEVGVRERTVTKTCIKLPAVTARDMSSDSPLHWIPCHSSLNGQIDKFMHNWGLYYEKENDRSVYFFFDCEMMTSGGWKRPRDRWMEKRKKNIISFSFKILHYFMPPSPCLSGVKEALPPRFQCFQHFSNKSKPLLYIIKCFIFHEKVFRH